MKNRGKQSYTNDMQNKNILKLRKFLNIQFKLFYTTLADTSKSIGKIGNFPEK